MRRIYSVTLLSLFAISAGAQGKLDLSARMLMQNYQQISLGANPELFDPRLSVNPLSRGESGVPEVGVIVKIDPRHNASELCIDTSIRISVDLGDLVVISAPMTKLDKLASLPFVKSISAGEINTTQMYFARTSGTVTAVHAGEDDLPMAYTGSDVVVGMMDQGIDPNHINFSKRSDVNNSRVKEVYAYTNGNGIPTQSCTTPEAIKAFTTDMTDATHGTHVMGIAAGSFNGEGSYGLSGQTYTNQPIPFYGVATDADIVMAGGILTDANIIAGVKNVMDYSESVGKPAVCNLSLGSVLGPHDGSDALNQSLKKLGERGIICVSAGNDGDTDCAMKMSGGRSASARTNAVEFDYGTSSASPYTVQFWSNNSDEFKLEFVIYNSATNSVVYSLDIPNNNGLGTGIGGSSMSSDYVKDSNFSSAFTDTSYAIFWSDVSADNNRYCVQMQFILNRGSSSDMSLSPAIRITRNSGQEVYGYINTPKGNVTGAFRKQNGAVGGLNWSNTTVSSNGSISDLATGSNIIPVGAYTSSQFFTLQDGTRYSYNGSTGNGVICGFSSYGTNPVTGENLPIICAPGSAIVSSVSNYYTGSQDVCATAGGNSRTNKWGPMQGTSMSCPFVSGVVALWLQADPTLTVDRVREVIQNTSTPYTGSDSDLKIKWGAGKIDALEGIKYVLANKAAIGEVWADDNQRLIVTDNGSGYEVFVADGGQLTATLYDLQGRPVARATGADGTATVDCGSLSSGLYILEARSDSYRLTRKVTRR